MYSNIKNVYNNYKNCLICTLTYRDGDVNVSFNFLIRTGFQNTLQGLFAFKREPREPKGHCALV